MKKLTDLWLKVLETTRRITLLITFIVLVISFISLVYWVFVCYDFPRIISTSMFIVVSILLNNAFQS